MQDTQIGLSKKGNDENFSGDDWAYEFSSELALSF